MAMLGEGNTWRKSIISQLQERNRTQTQCFQDLITFHNRLFDNANALRVENIQLSIQNEKLRINNAGSDATGSSSQADCKAHDQKLQTLEQKLLAQQEELTELHRRKGENSQQIIDLNKKLQEKEKQLAALDVSLTESVAINTSLRAEIRMFQNSICELEKLNQVLRDEHQALQLAFASIEEKLRKAQDENRHLIERLIKYKSTDADKMNEENENFLKKRQAKMRKELQEAAEEPRGVSPDNLPDNGSFSPSALPTNATMKFDAHDGEINAVKWSPVDRLVATGGADRKVKLWDVSKGVAKSRGVLVGSNAGVMSVDFDSTGTLCLGASNDFASRVWTVVDHRLKHTLTGHSGKVMAAKFLGDPSKVVSGSHDRTLKIWDLRSRVCTETKFAGSSCNDLVTSDGSGSTIISGHFDKRIRFWDTRTPESTANDIILQGKVTSLDLTRDCNYLLACVRDDTLKLLDLRMNQIIKSFSCDGFKVGCDWSRATFSPDGQYISVGSSDGGVYVWGVTTNKVEAILKDHGSSGIFSRSAVTATSWHPYGSYLASVDKAKKAIIWQDV